MLRVLCVEDSVEDATLLAAQLEKTFGDVALERVATPDEFRRRLAGDWDVVVADHALPGFSALGALRMLQETGRDIPFVVVSGTLEEDAAVEAMRAGAQDFITKRNLARLGPAVVRELKDAAIRQGRARAEALLRVAQARLGTVLRSTQDTVFTFDGALQVTATYGALLLPERPGAGELAGGAWVEILAEVGRAHEAELRRALANEDAVFEWSHEDRTGQRRHFQTAVSPLRGEPGAPPGGVAITREITRLKQMESELVVSERMAAVGALAASVAHEVNNPLAAVLANLGIAAEGLTALAAGGDTAPVAEALGEARIAAERVRDIVRDLRILSRGDEGQATVDVRAVLESTIRLAWNEIRHRARLVREFGAAPPVRGNETRLGQVFLNLLMNAAQACPEGAASACVITVRMGATPDGQVCVEVQDSGCGMPPETVARLFTPFFTTKPKATGTGLGLSISRRIVSELGGRIEVESSPGKGSVFRVLLPGAHPVGTAAAPPQVRPVPTAPPRRARVLVIDDDPGVARAIRRALQAQHEVVLAEALEALERIRSGERFDLVLCDLMMPSIGGAEVHARMGACAPALAARMLFITGGAFTPAAEEFLKTVEGRRISKPFTPDELRRIVNSALEAP